MELFRFIDITGVFTALAFALGAVKEWADSTIIQLGTISVSVFDLAVGALVIGTIMTEFIPWSDDDEKAVMWED